MLKYFESVELLHLEITDVCQAECPQCARETDILFNKTHKHYLSIDDLNKVFPNQYIKSLKKLLMCGNYGDPAAGDALAIVDHFRNYNKTITVGMNTNGGLRTPDWWQTLAQKLHQPTDYVVFSIDGLEDTNHIYRKNVVWNKIMANAEAYISAGGLAHWDMLVFEHNQHQVEACQKLAKDMGFYFFRAKVSRRHHEYPISFLKEPKGWKNPVVKYGVINCSVLEENSLYISAQAKVHPCCWTGVLRGPTIVDFDSLQKSWSTNPHDICRKTCSSNTTGNSFTNQWQREIQLF